MGQQGLPPGFRFSPTDEELVLHYLRNKSCGSNFHEGVIAEVDIYKFEPWDLPEKSVLPSRDPEWYFFNAQDKRHSHTARINRTTSKGYWKATGKDRKVCSGPCTVGVKKTLVYYEGRAPSGKRTDWIMHEYRLDEEYEKKVDIISAAALCRVRKKGGPGPRNGEQYGAPISSENDEMEPPLSREGLADDVDEKLPELSESIDQPEVFNPPDQPKALKLPGKTVLPGISSERRGIDNFSSVEGLGTECELDLDAFLQSFISDTTQMASLESGMVPAISDQEGGIIPSHRQFLEMQNGDALSSDLDALPVLPSLHDVLHPAFGEAEMLGEMLHLIATSQDDVSDVEWNERVMPLAPADNHDGPFSDDECLMGGDFIELADMNSPLDGFVLRSVAQGVEFGRREEQQQFTMCNGVGTNGWVPDVLHTQGSAARRARLQIGKNMMNAEVLQQPDAIHSVFPEVRMHLGGVSNDIGIQIAGDTLNNGGGSFDESTSGSGVNPVVSSTRSFLSKHMSFYTVSKCEEAPPQLYYAALTDSQDEDPIGAVYSTALTIKDESKVETAAFEEDSFIPVASSGSFRPLTTTSCTQESSSDFEAAHDPSESEHQNTTSPLHRYFWKNAFRRLVSRAKSSSFGARLIQLEGCVRTRFNDKVFALGKPAAQLFPMKDYVNPYNSLRRGVMVPLFHLAAAVVIFFCLLLGFRTLTKYAFTISV